MSMKHVMAALLVLAGCAQPPAGGDAVSSVGQATPGVDQVLYAIFPASYGTNVARAMIVGEDPAELIAESLVVFDAGGRPVPVDVSILGQGESAPEADDDPSVKAFMNDTLSQGRIYVSGFPGPGWYRLHVPHQSEVATWWDGYYEGSETSFVRDDDGYFADLLVGVSRPGINQLDICDMQAHTQNVHVRVGFSQSVRVETADIGTVLRLFDESDVEFSCEHSTAAARDEGYIFRMTCEHRWPPASLRIEEVPVALVDDVPLVFPIPGEVHRISEIMRPQHTTQPQGVCLSWRAAGRWDEDGNLHDIAEPWQSPAPPPNVQGSDGGDDRDPGNRDGTDHGDCDEGCASGAGGTSLPLAGLLLAMHWLGRRSRQARH